MLSLIAKLWNVVPVLQLYLHENILSAILEKVAMFYGLKSYQHVLQCIVIYHQQYSNVKKRHFCDKSLAKTYLIEILGLPGKISTS